MSKLFDVLQRAGQHPSILSEQTATTEIESGTRHTTLESAPSTHALPAGIRTVRVKPDEPAIFPFGADSTSAAEQYRIIRTKVIHASKQPGITMVTSAAPGDGKTVTALNLAGALALRNTANVLLVDGDLVHGSVAKKLHLPPAPGVAELLNGTCRLEEAVVRIEQLPNLYVIPAGEVRQDHTELLDSPRWRALGEVFRREFPMTVLDSPPMVSLADYELLLSACDGVVFVIRPDFTNRALCMRGLESIPKEKLIGVVLNAADPSSVSGNYSYYGYSYNAAET